MQMLPWILVAGLAALVVFLVLRPGRKPYADAIARIAEQAEDGEDLGASAPNDPPELARLRLALSKGWRPVRAGEDPGERALLGLFRYLNEAALTPLEEALRGAGARAALEDAANALRDLSFYARGKRSEETKVENLSALVQGVAREYTRDTGVAIRFDGPPAPVPVRIAPESFKDALYLLLANADRFGGGGTIDITLTHEGEKVRLCVRDRGAGFTQQALTRAFDPFWTSESDALGLGLTHARTLLADQGAALSIGNCDGGGGEATVLLERARSGDRDRGTEVGGPR